MRLSASLSPSTGVSRPNVHNDIATAGVGKSFMIRILRFELAAPHVAQFVPPLDERAPERLALVAQLSPLPHLLNGVNALPASGERKDTQGHKSDADGASHVVLPIP